MAWDQDMQDVIDKMIGQHDLGEVIATAIDDIVSARIVQYAISTGGPVNYSTSGDPAVTLDFGERLLCAAIDELRSHKD